MSLDNKESGGKYVLLQLVWMVAAGAIPFVIYGIVSGNWILKNTIDIHVHDTMIIVEPFTIILPLGLLSIFIVFIIKENRKSYRKTLPNVIITLAGILFVYLVFPITVSFQMGTDQWNLNKTIGWEEEPDAVNNSVERVLSVLFQVLFLIITVSVLYVVFKWGRSGRKESK